MDCKTDRNILYYYDINKITLTDLHNWFVIFIDENEELIYKSKGLTLVKSTKDEYTYKIFISFNADMDIMLTLYKNKVIKKQCGFTLDDNYKDIDKHFIDMLVALKKFIK